MVHMKRRRMEHHHTIIGVKAAAASAAVGVGRHGYHPTVDASTPTAANAVAPDLTVEPTIHPVPPPRRTADRHALTIGARRRRRSIRLNPFCGCILTIHRPLCRPVDRATRWSSHRQHRPPPRIDYHPRCRSRSIDTTVSPGRPGDTATIPPPTPGHRPPPTSSRPRSTRPHSSADRQPTFLAPIDGESTYRPPRVAAPRRLADLHDNLPTSRACASTTMRFWDNIVAETC